MKITRVPDSGLARRREPGGTEAKLSENEKITAGLPRHRCAKCEQSGGFGYRDHASTLIKFQRVTRWCSALWGAFACITTESG
jgi:hypothetical protein